MEAKDTVKEPEDLTPSQQQLYGQIKPYLEAQAEISFPLGEKQGIKKVVDYFSRRYMGASKGMLLYEIPDRDRVLLEDGIVPNGE